MFCLCPLLVLFYLMIASPEIMAIMIVLCVVVIGGAAVFTAFLIACWIMYALIDCLFPTGKKPPPVLSTMPFKIKDAADDGGEQQRIENTENNPQKD